MSRARATKNASLTADQKALLAAMRKDSRGRYDLRLASTYAAPSLVKRVLQSLVKRGLVRAVEQTYGVYELTAAGRNAVKDAAGVKENPSQVAKVQARGGKRFVVATDSKESDTQLLDRVNAVKVIKRVNTNPGSPVNEWDDEEFSDEELNEASRQGWLGATAMRREHTKRAAGPKFFNVTWYSKQRGKRTGFIRPIEARTQSEAIKQAKAMITNEKTVSNFVAKEAKRNPRTRAINASIGEKIAQLTREGMPHNQAVAAAFSEKRAGKVNPSEYDRNVDIIEKDLRRIKRELSADKTTAISKPNIRQLTRSHGLTIPPSAYSRAFDEAFSRVFRSFSQKHGKPLMYKTNPKRAPKTIVVATYDEANRRIAASETSPGKGATLESAGRTKDGKFKLARKNVKRNPSTRAMSERFNGQASGAIVELKAPDSAPRDLSRAGKLVLLKLVDTSKSLRIPGAVVCIDPKTERLWIAGNRSPLLNRKAKPGERLNCGEIDRIVYETAKRHIGAGKTFEYDHKFGEDGGRRPSLYIDADGMPLIIGGDYRIRREGIVN